ncbi:uncharacterized protein [Chamaea fasciata]|uniref:uncharacterized protein n=1 Tax=Chamaea fasciata TaxID=190680 RepID=UPI003369FAEE
MLKQPVEEGGTGSEQGPEGKAQTPEEIRRQAEAAAGGCTAGIQQGQQSAGSPQCLQLHREGGLSQEQDAGEGAGKAPGCQNRDQRPAVGVWAGKDGSPKHHLAPGARPEVTQTINSCQQLLDQAQSLVWRDCNYSNLERIRRESIWDEESSCWKVPEPVIQETHLPAVVPAPPQPKPGRTGSSNESGEPVPEEDHYRLVLDRSDSETIASNYFRSRRAGQILHLDQAPAGPEGSAGSTPQARPSPAAPGRGSQRRHQAQDGQRRLPRFSPTAGVGSRAPGAAGAAEEGGHGEPPLSAPTVAALSRGCAVATEAAIGHDGACAASRRRGGVCR